MHETGKKFSIICVHELQAIASGQIALHITTGDNTGTNAASASLASLTRTRVFSDTALSAMMRDVYNIFSPLQVHRSCVSGKKIDNWRSLK